MTLTSAAPSPAARVTFAGRTLRALLFDMDGVIADTREAHMLSWVRYAGLLGRTIDPEEFMRMTFGRGNNEVLTYFFPERAGDLPFLAEEGRRKELLFLEEFQRLRVGPLAGLEDLLRRAGGAGLRSAVGSSAPRMNIDAVIGGFGMMERFETIVSMEDVRRAKPAPDIFLLCAERLGVPPQDCLVLEDSLHGLHAARAAGCTSIGFATMHAAEELAPHCNAVVKDFHGVAQLLFSREC